MKTIFPIDANVEHTEFGQGRQGQDQASTEGERKDRSSYMPGQDQQDAGVGGENQGGSPADRQDQNR